MKTNGMEGQMSIFDLDICFGKMCVEHSQATKGKTLESSLKKQPKSQTKMPQFLDLRTGSGKPADASWQTDGALLGEYSMHSFGESPKEDVESLLSQILEDNPHPKYFLSDKACLGILNRANRRGKKLPPMLEEALIQMIVGGTEYGQKGIADTIEVLRKMRCEIGEENLGEWVQRSFVLVQSKEILLGEMCESCEDTEDSNERIVVEGDCEEDDGEGNVCDMLYNGEVGNTPQRPQPNEQLCRELDMLMQKLPHKDAQKAVILYCLRITCESEETVSETLSAIPQGKSCTLQIRCGCEGGGKGALIQTEKSATLSTSQTQTLFQAVGCDMYNQDLTGDKSATVGVNCGLSTGRNGVVVYDARGNGDGKTVCTITGGHCATISDYTPIVMEAFQHHGYRESGVCGTLTAGKNNCVRGDTPFVVQPTVISSDGDKAGTLDSSYYKGCGMRSGIEGDVVAIKSYGFDPSAGRDIGQYFHEECGNTVVNGTCYGYHNGVCIKAVDCRNGTESEINNSLQANSAHSLNGNNVVRCRYIVRRLTPLECERLQGYPDRWTDIGEWTDTNGKKHKIADAPRYKALGNSIALPSWKWVLKRLCACYERDATMASLFDGIGGFPLIWEQLNGKGTCLWASEIEEFPIAVTKKRIGGD